MIRTLMFLLCVLLSQSVVASEIVSYESNWGSQKSDQRWQNSIPCVVSTNRVAYVTFKRYQEQMQYGGVISAKMFVKVSSSSPNGGNAKARVWLSNALNHTDDATRYSTMLAGTTVADISPTTVGYPGGVSEYNLTPFVSAWLAAPSTFTGVGVTLIRNGQDCRYDLNNQTVETKLVITLACAGDSNKDGQFTSADLVAVYQAGKYETGSPATWETGDWNADGVFNSSDLVAAYQDGCYENGGDPIAAFQALLNP